MSKHTTTIRLLACAAFVLPVLHSRAQQWQPVPMVSQKILDAGHFGGEGLQWPQAICIDQQEGSFILYGTDVGGIFRSTNGGERFEPANVGYHARGNCGFAIDPNNIDRAIAVAGNSGANPQHGLYLTTDRGASWSHVLKFGDYKGYRDNRDQVAYDPSSYDSILGYSTIAYWSKTDENNAGGIFKSLDGGASWEKITDSYARSVLKIHPSKGYIYLANGDLFRSMDGGATFDMIEAGVSDIDVIMTRPDRIYAVRGDGIYLSENSGDTFSKITGGSFPSDNPHKLCVYPAQPDTMVIANSTGKYNSTRHYSHDGGATWSKSGIDNSLAWGAYNNRPVIMGWMPNKPHVWSVGGAWATRSTDAGKEFEWFANGLNIVMIGGLTNINPNAPDNIFLGFQDQNAGFSTDGGTTWKYCNVSGLGWGGHCYGGYAASDQVLFTGLAGSWGGQRELRISFDGGNTWSDPNVTNGGIDVSFSDPVNPQVLFFGNQRSTDGGHTWAPMPDCHGICTASPTGNRDLYGVSGNQVVRSADRGASWSVVASLPGKAVDVAYDHLRDRIYAAMRNDGFCYVDGKSGEVTMINGRVPVDQYGSSFQPRSVAVDPVQPEVVYAAQARGPYKTDVAVVRSVNAGQTWQILNRNKRVNNTHFGIPGGQEARAVSVHPDTRELWVGTGCYGNWKIGPPETTYPGVVVRLLRPAHGDTLVMNDSILFEAEVIADSLTAEKVEFYIGDQKLGEAFAAPFSMFWKQVSPGDYLVRAEATDTTGNLFSSQPYAFTILASLLPTASIASPMDGEQFAYDPSIRFEVDASDPDGNIQLVKFFVDGEKVEEDTAAPYFFLWEDAAPGTYELSATATDNTGQTVPAGTVRITVDVKHRAITYLEDFDDGIAQEWTTIAGFWEVDGNQYWNTTNYPVENAIYTGTTFASFDYSAMAMPVWGNPFGLIFNYQDEDNYYLARLNPSPMEALLVLRESGNETILATNPYSGGGEMVWLKATVCNDGYSTTLMVNDSLILDGIPTHEFSYGYIGLHTTFNHARFDNVHVEADTTELTGNLPVKVQPAQKVRVFPNPLSSGSLMIHAPEDILPLNLEIIDIRALLRAFAARTAAGGWPLIATFAATAALPPRATRPATILPSAFIGPIHEYPAIKHNYDAVK